VTVADRVLLQAANRSALSYDVARAVHDVSYEGSMESAPTLSLTILDPDDDLMRSHLLVRRAVRSLGTPEAFTLRAIDLMYEGIPYRLSDANREGDFVGLEFKHRAVAYMEEIDHAISASRNATTRAMFIRRQVREVGRRKRAPHRLAFWAPELRVRQPVAASDDAGVSANAEPDRDPGEVRESARSFKGLTIKGAPMNADQRRNVAIALGVATDVNAGQKATLAMLCAGIAEAAFKTVANAAGSGAFGPFQVMPATARAHGVSQTDVAAHARIFLVGGKGRTSGQSFTGGPPAVKVAQQNPGMSPGAIADRIEGGGAGAAFYEAFRREAEALMASGPGVSTVEGGGGSYVKPFTFKRDEGVNAWESTGTLATDVNRRRFVTVTSPRKDVFIYAGDADLMKLRPQASFAPDDPEVVSFNYGLTMGKTARTARVLFLPGEVDLAWGLPVMVEGGGGPGGKWLVWDWGESDDSGMVEVELRQPQPVKPEPASEIVRRAEDSAPDNPSSGERVGDTYPGSPVPGQRYHTATHETAGLPGFPAFDYMAPAGTPCVSPVDGKVYKRSGSAPGAHCSPGGACGYSVYISGGGKSYFLTHIDKVTVGVGDRVRQGEQIAVVADGPRSWSTPHVHMGVRDAPGSR
jgi:murein DD-endopeptidase MepM/ murein hydrolase activator NlpD